MASTSSPKRSFDETGLGQIDHQNAPSVCIEAYGQQLGPSPSSICEAFPTVSGPTPQALAYPGIDLGSNPPVQHPPSKRSKPSIQSVSASALAKEQKERQTAEVNARKQEEKIKKEEEKARKLEEKAKKEDERARRDAEKEQKRKAKEDQIKLKEAEKQKKEEEKQRKEDERNRKAKSQLRLNAFFCGAQGHQDTNDAGTSNGKGSPVSSRRNSEACIVPPEVEPRSDTPSVTPSKQTLSDYHRHFPDFFLQRYTRLAPVNRFLRDEHGMSHARSKIEGVLSDPYVARPDQTFSMRESLHLPYARRPQPPCTKDLKEILRDMDGSAPRPIDLTDTSTATGKRKSQPGDALKKVSMKYLKFAEDVRPPYVGTYCKAPTSGSLSSLARKPFGQVRPDTNYDYDSEAEWEELGEGEDLDSDGEDDEEDEEEEAEMEGFLDDDDPNAIKRRPILGFDQEPKCSGICWEGELLSSGGDPVPDHRQYEIIVLLDNPELPIDPFSTSYWQEPAIGKSTSETQRGQQQTLMEPPRVPLSPVNRGNTLLPFVTAPTSSLKPSINVTNKAPRGSKRFISSDLLQDFRHAVHGSDLTKIALIEALKKQFPKQPKDAIKDTLDVVAVRMGAKNTDKRWSIRDGFADDDFAMATMRQLASSAT